jgi:hypothetical protein
MRRNTIENYRAAAECYRRRQSRREHPDGTFDKRGRWYPADCEEQPCCAFIRSPSARWPYSYMTHCRTVGHVAALHGIPVGDLRRYLRTGRMPDEAPAEQAAA